MHISSEGRKEWYSICIDDNDIRTKIFQWLTKLSIASPNLKYSTEGMSHYVCVYTRHNIIYKKFWYECRHKLGPQLFKNPLTLRTNVSCTNYFLYKYTGSGYLILTPIYLLYNVECTHIYLIHTVILINVMNNFCQIFYVINRWRVYEIWKCLLYFSDL